MSATAATALDHPDPGLTPRLYVADRRRVFETLHASLVDGDGWVVDEAEPEEGRLVGSRRRLLPPGRDVVEVRVETHDERTVEVVGEATRSGFPTFRWQARQALKEVLWMGDALFQRADQSPLRTEGYDRS